MPTSPFLGIRTLGGSIQCSHRFLAIFEAVVLEGFLCESALLRSSLLGVRVVFRFGPSVHHSAGGVIPSMRHYDLVVDE
jgi:hypothetical protein